MQVREKVLQQIEEAFEATGRWIALIGEPGVGKSYLAQRAQVDRQRWSLELDAVRSIEEVTARLQQLLAEEREEEVSGPVEEMMLRIEQPGLVLLDNADDLLEMLPGLWEHWRAQVPGWTVVTTSRAAPRGADRVIQVEPLQDAESLALLRSEGDLEVIQRADTPGLERLVTSLGGNPLAVLLAARRMRLLSIDEILARMERQPAALLRGGHGRFDSLERALHLSRESLGPEQELVLAACASFARSFDLAAIESMLAEELGMEEILDSLQVLVDQALVRRQQLEPARFGIARPFRSLLRQEMSSELGAKLERAHREHFERRAEAWMESSWEDSGARLWELDEIIEAFECARKKGRGYEVAVFARFFSWMLGQRGQTTTWFGAAGEESHERRIRAQELLIRAQTLARDSAEIGQAQRALEEGIALLQRDDDGDLALEFYQVIARLYLKTRHHAQAAVALREAVTIARGLGLHEVGAKLLERLARLQRAMGSPELERESIEAALEMLESIERQGAPSERWLSLRFSQARLIGEEGDWEEAASRLHETLLLAQLTPWVPAEFELRLRRLLIDAACLRLQPQEARQQLEEACDLVDRKQLNGYLVELSLRSIDQALWEGELELAREEVKQLEELRTMANFSMLGASSSSMMRMLPEAVELRRAWLAVLSGERDQARAMLEGLAEDCASARSSRNRRLGLRCMGFISVVRSLEEENETLVQGLELLLQGASEDAFMRACLEVVRGEVFEEEGWRFEVEMEPLGICLLATLSERLQQAPDEGDASHWLALAEESRQRETLLVEVDSLRLVTPAAEIVDLSNKTLLANLFEALVQARLERPGEALQARELFDAGWPGQENIQEKSAKNRLRVAMRRLRQAGLQGYILTEGSGYLLDHELALERIEP